MTRHSSQPKETIVRGGNDAFQVPLPLIHAEPTTPMDGRACRVLAWILAEAHASSLWPTVDQEPADTLVRHQGQALLAGAGLDPRQGYNGLRKALAQVVALQYDGIQGSLIWDCSERPGRNFDILLSATLMQLHARPLGSYALLNMAHVRQLTEALDLALYARACHVARAWHPVFEMSINEVACYCRTGQVISWRSLRRQFLASITRVCAATGGRCVVQGWCSGEIAGIDRLRIHVGMANDNGVPKLRLQHGAIFFDVRPQGAQRISVSPVQPTG
jgi:hypothetical protein